MPALQHGPQPCGVVEGAQEVDARHPLGTGQHEGPRARGDDQGVVRDRAAPGVQFVCRGPQSRHVEAEAQGDAECLEVDVEGGVLGLAEQDRLGEGRPVVRLMRFGADQRDGSGEALFAQGHGGLHSGHARSGDHHMPPRCSCLSRLTHPPTLST
ncbi:hypothetical protein Sfulv_14010 [Streptomyces fulvorobeus]|uniref:Uncharacterized protein n=1 Tax=Streptomyces fulvorobeus TaxID=284028 RepID=A0A7J0C255_9ACTN|nr:hypothetical protein Sfulv_14010 [Streptomyces fulvorobeus]